MSKSEYDLTEDAPRYVVEALAAVREQDPKQTVDSLELASNWVLPRPSNYIEMRALYADEMDEKRSEVGEDSVKEWLINSAINDVNANNDNYLVNGEPISTGDSEVIQDDDDKGNYRLADGVDIHALKLRGEPLLPKTVPTDLFAPGGKWADISRSYDPAKLGPLRDSMEALGWPKHLPAIGDKRTKDTNNPIIIVGHRRLEVAEELGIEPVIGWVDFGEGPAAEAAKIALALASNTGGENISLADRKKIAKDLYGTDKFSMTDIAKLLKVSAMTVSRDLAGLTDVKPPPERGGRPRKGDKGSQPKPTPQPEPKPLPEAVPAPPTLPVVPEPEPEPEPEQPSPGEEPPVELDAEVVNPGPWLETILGSLTEFADWVEGLDADERTRFAEHTTFAEILAEIGQQVRRTLTIMFPMPSGPAVATDDDANIERVAKGIGRWLDKYERGTRGAIRKSFSAPDRKYVETALEALIQMKLIVVAADGQIELGQEASS